jgi:hypothetical protein
MAMRVMMIFLMASVGVAMGACAQDAQSKQDSSQFRSSSDQLGGMRPSSGLGGFTATSGGWGPGNSGFHPAESPTGRKFKGY